MQGRGRAAEESCERTLRFLRRSFSCGAASGEFSRPRTAVQITPAAVTAARPPPSQNPRQRPLAALHCLAVTSSAAPLCCPALYERACPPMGVSRSVLGFSLSVSVSPSPSFVSRYTSALCSCVMFCASLCARVFSLSECVQQVCMHNHCYLDLRLLRLLTSGSLWLVRTTVAAHNMVWYGQAVGACAWCGRLFATAVSFHKCASEPPL